MKEIKILKAEISLLSEILLQSNDNKASPDLIERFKKLISFKQHELDSLENSFIHSFGSLERSISEIKQKLNIDFDLSFDYSFIKNNNVKLQLIADNRAMLRARLGLPDGLISFESYCRYAHYQIEELLNYYYGLVFFKRDDELNKYFQRTEFESKKVDNGEGGFNKSPMNKKIESIAHIEFHIKHKKFKEEFKPQSHSIISRLNSFRNSISHRCTILNNDDDTILNIYVKTVKYKKWEELKLNPEGQKLKNDGLDIEFRKSENFIELNNALKEYISIFSREIIKVQDTLTQKK